MVSSLLIKKIIEIQRTGLADRGEVDGGRLVRSFSACIGNKGPWPFILLDQD